MLIKKKDCLYLSILILVFIITRTLLLFNIERFASGNDSAIMGIMAKHVLEGKMHSLYAYGIQYNGGSVIGAYIAAFFFKLFGMSSFTLKLSSLFISVILLASTYIFVKRFFGGRAAVITSLLFVLSPGIFSRHNVRAMPGYMLTLIFEVLLLFLFFVIFYENKKKPAYFALLGLASAIAIWNYEFIIILLAVCLLFCFLNDKGFFFKRGFFVYFSLLVIGLVPVIHYNLTHNLGNFKNMFYGTLINRIVCSYHLLPKTIAICPEGQQFSKFVNPVGFFTVNLPSLFSSGKHYIYEVGVYSLSSWVYYIVFLISFIFLIYLNRKGFLIIFKKDFSHTKKELIIIVFILVFMLSYISKGSQSVHYLLPLYPFVLIVISLFLSYNYKKNKIFSLSLLMLLVVIGIYQNLSLANAKTNSEGEGKFSQQNFEGILELIDFLNSKNISHVYATSFIQWKVLFESKESIIASCYYLCPCMTYNTPNYTDIVNSADRYAYIFFNDSDYNLKLISYLNKSNIAYNTKKLKAVNVYYDFSGDVRPNTVFGEWDILC